MAVIYFNTYKFSFFQTFSDVMQTRYTNLSLLGKYTNEQANTPIHKQRSRDNLPSLKFALCRLVQSWDVIVCLCASHFSLHLRSCLLLAGGEVALVS